MLKKSPSGVFLRCQGTSELAPRVNGTRRAPVPLWRTAHQIRGRQPQWVYESQSRCPLPISKWNIGYYVRTVSDSDGPLEGIIKAYVEHQGKYRPTQVKTVPTEAGALSDNYGACSVGVFLSTYAKIKNSKVGIIMPPEQQTTSRQPAQLTPQPPLQKQKSWKTREGLTKYAYASFVMSAAFVILGLVDHQPREFISAIIIIAIGLSWLKKAKGMPK